MYVVKRDQRKEAVKFDKITARIIKMCYGLDPLVSPEAVAMKVIEGLFDGVTTTQLDNLAAEVAAAKTIDHPDYALLASRIADYFSVPSRTSLPSLTDIGGAGAMSGGNTATITGNPSTTITIKVTDSSTRCPDDYQNGMLEAANAKGYWDGSNVYTKLMD